MNTYGVTVQKPKQDKTVTFSKNVQKKYIHLLVIKPEMINL